MTILYWDHWSNVEDRYIVALLTVWDVATKKTYQDIRQGLPEYQRKMLDALYKWVKVNGGFTGVEHQNENYGVPVFSNGFAVRMPINVWDYFIEL